MPIQAPQWTDYLNCPVCCHEFGMPPRSPISLGCGHTLCKHCLQHLHRKQCPFDQTAIHVEQEEFVVNTALLQLAGYPPPAQPHHPSSIHALPEHDRLAYDCTVKCMEHLAAYLKFCGNATNSMSGSRLSRPMQRKLVILLQCAITDEEGRGRAARAVRSLGERTVTELILQHQNPQQLSANLWAAVRARGCQFLGPAMQEEVLKLVLLALEDGSALSRKVLVMFVVQRLEPHFPQASKTSIGHVVQLLYRASCFKVSKRECDSSLMQLKEEFRTYESLRREHDAQIVQIATEAGLRIAPDQWSALLYGDTAHKSHMQSIIDKLQTPQSFAQSVQELFIALQRTGDPAQLIVMSLHLDRLTNIDASLDAKCPSWQQLAELMTSLKEVVAALIHYLQQQTGRDSNHNQKHIIQERCLEPNSQTAPQTAASTPTHAKYKVAMCRDAATRAFCPRGNSCTFAHTDEEIDRYRTNQMNGNFVLVPVPNHQGIPPMQAQGIQGMPLQPQPPGYPPYIAQPVMENHNYLGGGGVALRSKKCARPCAHACSTSATMQHLNLGTKESFSGYYRDIMCYRCGQKHRHNEKCRARIVECFRCHRVGHLAKMCQTFIRAGRSELVEEDEKISLPMVAAVNIDIPENHMNNGHQAAAYPVQHHQMLIMNNDIIISTPGGERPYYGHFPGPRLPEDHRPNMQYLPEMAPPPAFAPRASSAPNMHHPAMFQGPPQDAMTQDEIFNPAVIPAELLPEYCGPSTYGTVPFDRRTDAVWAPNLGDQMFNFTEMRNALPTVHPGLPAEPQPGPSSAPDLPVNQVADRRVVGADRVPRGDRPERMIVGTEDDRELEAGLQALERQIDTEFKNAD